MSRQLHSHEPLWPATRSFARSACSSEPRPCRSAILTIAVETPPNCQAMASIGSVFAWLVRHGDMRSLSIRYMYRPSAPARLIGLPSSNKSVVRVAKNTLQSENDARISGCRQPLAGMLEGLDGDPQAPQLYRKYFRIAKERLSCSTVRTMT